ncbi:MAG: hypothetical protein GEV08_00660 [Acidimicrobiia bacterium]|nr:hypothetical protein [Acidimicrobiia bacterium]
MKRKQVRVAVAILGTAAVLGLAGCGQDVDPISQPHIGGERFIEVRFDDVPFPPESTVLEEATGERTLLQTVTLETPLPDAAAVMAFYTPLLEAGGWQVDQEPQELSNGGLLGVWTRLGRTLVVDVEPGEVTADDPDPPVEIVLEFSRLRLPGSKLPDEEQPSSILPEV